VTYTKLAGTTFSASVSDCDDDDDDDDDWFVMQENASCSEAVM